MKYAYKIIFKNGSEVFTIQNYKFAEQQVLDGVRTWNGYESAEKVEFLTEIPKGYHLCGCGNLAKGTRDELCDECREIYGHYYEHEL